MGYSRSLGILGIFEVFLEILGNLRIFGIFRDFRDLRIFGIFRDFRDLGIFWDL